MAAEGPVRRWRDSECEESCAGLEKAGRAYRRWKKKGEERVDAVREYARPCQSSDQLLSRYYGNMKFRSTFRLFLLLLGFILLQAYTIGPAKRRVKLLAMRNRGVLRRMGAAREELKPKICYDLLGCFADPPPHLTLKRPPEHPSVIRTRFFLFTRENRDSPESLEYGDDSKSIAKSKYNATKALKVAIHGYKGSASDVGSLALARALLDLEDANVLLLDWTRGAATTYQAAVANTELVGRQLALVLLNLVETGTNPTDIHMIGFSLGAHIAGCTAELLKKNDVRVGRITGLDPASPFFRNHLFRDKARKLDASDAELVDVIHTDGSEDFADGFGLLKPIGHIDFFPNGGREQPGCVDVKNSVVVSHLKEDALDRAIACSHLRAVSLFLETLKTQKSACKFEAWPCPQGGISYQNGQCFPPEGTEWAQEMGYKAHRGPLGIYYLPTKEEAPFCGQPLRASIRTMDGSPRTAGVLFIKMLQENSTTLFKIRCALPRRRNDWTSFRNIAAAEYNSIRSELSQIDAFIWFEPIVEKEEDSRPRDSSDFLFLNKVSIEDRKGNRWEHCWRNLEVNNKHTLIELGNGRCNII